MCLKYVVYWQAANNCHDLEVFPLYFQKHRIDFVKISLRNMETYRSSKGGESLHPPPPPPPDSSQGADFVNFKFA